MTKRLPFYACVVWAFLGCQGEEIDTGDRFTVRDSAGINIVESSAPQLTGEMGWRINPEPVATYGYDVDDGEGMGLAGIAMVLEGGRPVAIDYAAQQLRFFGSDGTLETAAGGAGEGPGEFRGLIQIWRLPGDTIVAYDRGLARVSRFDPAGNFVDAVGLQGDPVPPQIVGVTSDHRFVGKQLTPPNWEAPEGSIQELTESFLVVDDFGDSAAPFASLPGERIRMFTSPTGPAYGSVLSAFNPGPVSVVGRGLLYHAYSDRYAIGVHSPTASPLRIIRRAEEDRAITGALVAAYEDELLDATREQRPESLPQLERELADAEYPEVFPAFDWFVVDTLGNLWVRSTRWPGESQTTWSVFDDAGAWLTEIDLPAQPRPAIFDIGDDYVLIRESDEVGIQYYARYQLLKPAS